MDLKDCAWTWKFNQKFDVVRQEVDEFVSMGTIKYVENQVQTLGGTVKDFCSNVFQDFIPPGSSNPVNHDAGTVPHEGKFVTETYKNSVSNLKEKYADTHTKSLPSALSNPVNLDAESVTQKGKHATQNNKPLIIIKEKYADIASKQIPTKQDSVHHVPPFYRLNNVKKTMPMPTEGDNKMKKALFPLARDESALLHDNLKTSVAGYIVSDCEERSLSEGSNSDFEGLVAKEKSFFEDLYSDYEGLVAKEKSLSEDLNLDFEGHVSKEKSLSEGSNSDFEGLVAKEKSVFEDLYSDYEGLVAKEKSLSEDLNLDFEGHVSKEKSLSEGSNSDFEGLVAKEKSLFEDLYSDYEGLVAKEKSLSENLNLDFEGLVAQEKSLSVDWNSIGINEDINLDFEGFFAMEKSLSEDSNLDFEGLVAKEKSLSEDWNSIGINEDINLDFAGLLAMEKSLSEDSNSIGINDETSLFCVTEDDLINHEITDEAAFATVDDSVRVHSSAKERTCDTFFDDYHCKISGIPQSSEVECSFSSGCQVGEPVLISSTSSLSKDSYYQSEFYTIPHETENFVYDDIDSVHSVSPGHTDESKINIPDPNMKTIDLSEKTKLNESCVIVDNKLLGATSYRPRRHRSYKQMIKDAYTSTKRLTKEYELLGILYEDLDKEPVQQEKPSRLPSISERTSENLGDYDWELL